MTKWDMREEISDYLQNLESQENVRVVYAVESGSRAWGFASPDSDFDIRYIYIRPAEWYLSVQKRRDVLEAMVDPELDFAGWDLQKTLVLLRKSNPSLIEWLASPIVYIEDTDFMADFRSLASQCVSLQACMKHYLSMASANWQSYFGAENVLLKKYLYVLRPIYACRWIERYQTTPPVAFDDLLVGAGEPGEVAVALAELLQLKLVTSELGARPHMVPLDKFIVSELARIRELKVESPRPIDYEVLDDFFRKWIVKAFTPRK